MKWNRKAQMEMIGLVIVVLLLTMGMLFMAKFALDEKPDKKIFTRKGLAVSSVSAMLTTTIPSQECGIGSIESLALGGDILEDCARNYMFPSLNQCGFGCQYECDSKHSCEFLRETFELLLAETLGQQGRNYEFHSQLIENFDRDNPKPIFEQFGGPIIGNNGCANAPERDSSNPFPIPLEGIGTVESILYMC
jgi:hypothetical protein